MQRYYVNFQTGVGNCYADILDDAIDIAIDCACYTKSDILVIDTQTQKVVYELRWWGYQAGEEDEPVVDFGRYGFYAVLSWD